MVTIAIVTLPCLRGRGGNLCMSKCSRVHVVALEGSISKGDGGRQED
jgi:hypothetical protein